MQEKLIDEIISIENQSFHLSILKYLNGCFISLTEGNEPRFGSMSMSLKQSNLVNTTIIIPSKFSPTILCILYIYGSVGNTMSSTSA